MRLQTGECLRRLPILRDAIGRKKQWQASFSNPDAGDRNRQRGGDAYRDRRNKNFQREHVPLSTVEQAAAPAIA